MELICLDCGNIFYDCEAVHAVDITSTPVGTIRTERSVCPACGSDDLEEAAHCRICGGTFREDELISGICKDCLRAQATEDNLREYLNDPYALESFAEFINDKRRKHGTDPLEKTH